MFINTIKTNIFQVNFNKSMKLNWPFETLTQSKLNLTTGLIVIITTYKILHKVIEYSMSDKIKY